ncbi:MAG: transglutaminase family protein, partial [bacterium]
VGWYSDLARTKTRSSYEIKELVHELLKGKENDSEEAKIKTIYNFITENIRYSSVSFRQSSFIPQKARDVLVNKIGDCKDMSTLTIAMLREAGIKAYYVLLNTKDRGRNENILPSIAFNHCIVAVATIEGWLYLDPTAYNYPAGSLPEIDIDGFSLLIKSDVKSPEYLSGNQVIPNNIFRKSRVEIRPDRSLLVQSKTLRSGALSASMRNSYRYKGQKEKEITLTELLSKEFPNIKLTKFEIENLDDLRPEVSYTYHFEVPNYVNESGQFLFLKIPWTDGLVGNRALSYEERKYPYNYWPWADTLVQEIEIQIPAGYEPLDLVKEVKFTSAIADYSISYSFSQGVLKGRRKFVNKKSVVLPEEYAEFKKYYNRVVNEDSKQILFKKIELALGMIEK